MKSFLIPLLIISTVLAEGQDLITKSDGSLSVSVYLRSQSWDYVIANDKTVNGLGNVADRIYTVTWFESIDIMKFFFIGGELKTYMIYNRAGSFLPFYTDYKFLTGVQYDGAFLRYEHNCTHPQNTLEGLSGPIEPRNTTNDVLTLGFRWTTP